MKMTIWPVIGALLIMTALLFFGCGGDEDDDEDEFPPETCSFWGCKVTCFYEAEPGENHSPVRIEHNVGDSIVESTEEYCTNNGLYRTFELNNIWGGDVMDACEDLEGYVTPDSTESVKFACENTEWHPAE